VHVLTWCSGDTDSLRAHLVLNSEHACFHPLLPYSNRAVGQSSILMHCSLPSQSMLAAAEHMLQAMSHSWWGIHFSYV